MMAKTSRRRRPGRPRGPSRTTALRQRLVREASVLYAERGAAALSFSALAERVGIQKPTVFHYFPSKDALVGAVFAEFGERLEAVVGESLDRSFESHAARVDHLVGALVDFYSSEPELARLLCWGLLEADPDSTNADPVFARVVDRLTELLREGIDAGDLVPGRPRAHLLAIGGIVLFELMLPEPARRAFGTGSDPGEIETRKRELVETVRRAVVRLGARMRRRR